MCSLEKTITQRLRMIWVQRWELALVVDSRTSWTAATSLTDTKHRVTSTPIITYVLTSASVHSKCYVCKRNDQRWYTQFAMMNDFRNEKQKKNNFYIITQWRFHIFRGRTLGSNQLNILSCNDSKCQYIKYFATLCNRRHGKSVCTIPFAVI